MRGRAVVALLTALHLIAGLAPAHAANADLVSIKTPRGVRQAFILIKAEQPVASVILFAGGKGALGLKSATTMKWGAENFLVRRREAFAAAGFTVAVMDAPSDRRDGMNAIFRMGRAHAADITAVAAYLKAQTNLPVWLIGTSKGTFSAAAGAIEARNIDGLVLTSTITRAEPDWKIARSHSDGVASMALSRITVPTLIVSHRHDECDLSPAADTPKLVKRLVSAAKVETVLLDGGGKAQSNPCEAHAPHGYWGIEEQAVAVIVKFIKNGGN